MKKEDTPEAVALIGDEIYFSSRYFEDQPIPKPKELHFVGIYSFRCKSNTGPVVLDLFSKVAPLKNVKNALISAGFVVMDLPQARKIIKKYFAYPRDDQEEKEVVETETA